MITSAGRRSVSRLPMFGRVDEWEWGLESCVAPAVAVYYGVVAEGRCDSASAPSPPEPWQRQERRGSQRRGQWEGGLQAQPNGLIGTLAGHSRAEPTIRPAAVGRGRRPPQGALSLLPDTLRLNRYNCGCVQLWPKSRILSLWHESIWRICNFFFFKIQELHSSDFIICFWKSMYNMVIENCFSLLCVLMWCWVVERCQCNILTPGSVSKRETEAESLSNQLPSISVPVSALDCDWGCGEKSTLITSRVIIRQRGKPAHPSTNGTFSSSLVLSSTYLLHREQSD